MTYPPKSRASAADKLVHHRRGDGVIARSSGAVDPLRLGASLGPLLDQRLEQRLDELGSPHREGGALGGGGRRGAAAGEPEPQPGEQNFAVAALPQREGAIELGEPRRRQGTRQ